MSYQLPQIVKTAERVMAEIEIAATRFPRIHRYTLGQDLRQRAAAVAFLAHKAWRERDQQQTDCLEQLSEAIDDLKLRMQLGQQVRAFASFNQFEALARLLADLGRQCGGWKKRRNAIGQNAKAAKSPQRPSILSSRAASSQANP